MSEITTRLTRVFLWIMVTVFVTLAIAVTALRVTLPKLNHFQSEIQGWVNQASGFDFEIEQVSGFWRNTHPSISLDGIKASTPEGMDIHFSAAKLEVEFDLIQTIIQLQPVVADLTIHQLDLDVSKIDWMEVSTEDSPSNSSDDGGRIVENLDQLFLRQLDDFALLNSKISYQAIDGDVRSLDIEKLKWRNFGKTHKAEGIVSVVDANLNSLSVSANFVDHGSLTDISGEFYVSADNVTITPWLTRYLQKQTGIQKGQVSFNSWITLEHNQPIDAYVELNPSELAWVEGIQHDLIVESGVFKLSPTDSGWLVSGQSLQVRTDHTPWPELDIAFDWQPTQWRLNLSQIDIEAIAPLVKLAPDSEQMSTMVDTLKLGGLIEDLRISMKDDIDSLRYSAELSNGTMKQWELLPGLHHLSAVVSGNIKHAVASVSLIDDVLPYGDVFQAPLNMKQAQVDIVWQRQDDGWSLWADKVTGATPDLQVLGAFRLDFPQGKSPFLSFYAEADLYNAGQTWRYLPTLALGQELTDYLSTAIQAGKVNTAKLLWYGELGNFPYSTHNGMFQAWVSLKDAKFSFDTAWPTITDLQLDLLFQNDAMYLDSRDATLVDVKAQRITGRIPFLGEGGHIEIEAKASGEGNAVRDYMTASPLVDSVGAALTAIQVSGPVSAEFQLNIPFSSDKEARAWGYADLNGNHVVTDAPTIVLEAVSGRIEFDNDVVNGAGLEAHLLEQPVSVDFSGENEGQGYGVAINVIGDWDPSKLSPYLGVKWTEPLSGFVPWRTDVDIQLSDVGFTYQIDSEADLKAMSSVLPFPLQKTHQQAGKIKLQASGNQETISSRMELPDAKYQAEINLRSDTPVLTATNLVIGKGNYKISPVAGHHAQVRTEAFDLDAWLELIKRPRAERSLVLDDVNMPAVPVPNRIDVKVSNLTFASLEWHNVDATAKRQALGWHLDLDSQEVKGEASYIEPYDLSISLDRLHIYVPSLDDEHKEKGLFDTNEKGEPLISDFDRQFHEAMPNLTLAIDDFWLQGYKVGTVNVDLQRQGDSLVWKDMTFKSGTNTVSTKGSWELTETESHSQFDINVDGENNSDVMERFGIQSGIQQASFEFSGQANWDGAPWSMQVDTLSGQVNTKFGKGVISDVSGAARLLGLFSLDSIIRKMQLDFTDVFDQGMAFNSIKGSGQIEDGIFVTNDLRMDAVAGEMNIKGLADLNTRLVDAEVNFVPDITSGIPVLTAFAVTPQTALYVLAITTVISPVVEVFTQVNYEVKGPLDSPTVNELSRSRGEFTLPDKLRKEAK